MDIKHSDPKLSVEEAWLTMTTMYIVWVLAVSHPISYYRLFFNI